MKVYYGSHPSKRDYKKVPQIKIKNEELRNSGFNIGTEFRIIYQLNKIILEVVSKEN